MLLEKKCSYCS